MQRISEFAFSHRRKLVWAGIGLYTAVFSAVCLWKYALFAYDGLDLAIFSQVIWNTAHGRLFEMSIHPHSYLGDHAGFAVLLLAPLYRLLPDPRTLLILQTAALALAAWPLFLLAERRFSGAGPAWRHAPLLLALAWLLNPLVHNINLFEFHLLPFALPPLMFALLAYEREQKGRFVAFALLALLVREDVSLVVAAFGLLAALERRSYWWRLVPIGLGAAWFAAATALIGRFAPAGGYKFTAYYAWLLDATDRPLTLVGHILSPGNAEMLLAFGIPLLFLPFLSPKRLVLAAGPLLAMVLGAPGGSAIVVETHYSALFLPALFAATVVGLNGLRTEKTRPGQPDRRDRDTGVQALLLVAATYGALTLGPLPTVAARLADPTSADLRARGATQVVESVPANATVVASYRLLPHLANRTGLHSAHYAFLGVTQFAAAPYRPEGVDCLAFDEEDFLNYRAQIPSTAWAAPHYDGGRERLSEFAVGEPLSRDGFRLYCRDGMAAGTEPEGGPSSSAFNYAFDDGTVLQGVRVWPVANRTLTMELDWLPGPAGGDSQTVVVSLDSDSASRTAAELPLANDPAAPPAEGRPIVGRVSAPLPDLPSGDYRIRVSLERRDQTTALDGLRSSILVKKSVETLGTLDVSTVGL